MFQGFEPYSEPLMPARAFARRVTRYATLAFVILSVSLLIGMVGYRWFEQMSWVDAFLNAAMILGGMGPVASLSTDGGKIFAGCYALFAGVVFLGAAGILLSPFVHRLQHRFHLDLDSDDNTPG